MELRQHIDLALKDAIRERDENRRNALRLLLTALKVKEKELKRLPNEIEIQQVIFSQINQRKDSAEQYTKGGRQDLASREEEEIRVLQAFLPEALSPEQLEQLVVETIAEVDAQSQKDMGRVMRSLMPKVAGRAEGRQISELVKKKLESGA